MRNTIGSSNPRKPRPKREATNQMAPIDRKNSAHSMLNSAGIRRPPRPANRSAPSSTRSKQNANQGSAREAEPHPGATRKDGTSKIAAGTAPIRAIFQRAEFGDRSSKTRNAMGTASRGPVMKRTCAIRNGDIELPMV